MSNGKFCASGGRDISLLSDDGIDWIQIGPTTGYQYAYLYDIDGDEDGNYVDWFY